MSEAKVAVHLFASDPSVFSLLPTLTNGYEVKAIIYPANRSETAKVAALIANTSGIPVFEHRKGEILPENLPDAECAVSWLYSQIFPTPILKRYRMGILNMHGGALPTYRGASVLQWAIINGEVELGVTWHSLVEAVDAGPIWEEHRIPIPAKANAAEVRQAMIGKAQETFPAAWSRFSSGAPPLRIPVPANERVWPQRLAKDGLIEKGWSEARVRNLVRALCAPWPPAYIMFSGRSFAVEKVVEDDVIGSIPYQTEEGRVIYLCASQRQVSK